MFYLIFSVVNKVLPSPFLFVSHPGHVPVAGQQQDLGWPVIALSLPGLQCRMGSPVLVERRLAVLLQPSVPAGTCAVFSRTHHTLFALCSHHFQLPWQLFGFMLSASI